MNFEFNDEQKMLRRSARALLKDHCSLVRVREVMDRGDGFDADLWSKIVENGWPAVAIPEAYGGGGYGYLELVMLAEELGRSIAPVPFAPTIYMAAEAIKQAGSSEQKSEWLPGIAAGEIVVAWAGTGVGDCRVSGGTLSGTAHSVVDGMVVDAFAVVCEIDGEPAIAMLRADSPGVRRTSARGIDRTRTVANIEFGDAPAVVLEKRGQAVLDDVINSAAAILAFEQLGGAEAAMRMATSYAQERYAFGQPIGGFQAIKHKIVDMFVKVELARSNCYYAAWALENKAPDLPLAAACARVSATDAFEFASRENMQVHGGIGFTWEADPHLFFKRSKMLALQLRGIGTWRERVMAELDRKAVA